MEYLNFLQIKVPAIVMVEYLNGTKVPFYVNSGTRGLLGESTLLGDNLSSFLVNPIRYLSISYNPSFIFPWADDFIKGCRIMTDQEKKYWLDQIKSVPDLKGLIELLS